MTKTTMRLSLYGQVSIVSLNCLTGRPQHQLMTTVAGSTRTYKGAGHGGKSGEMQSLNNLDTKFHMMVFGICNRFGHIQKGNNASIMAGNSGKGLDERLSEFV